MKKGFTLIELMIVVMLLVVLPVIVLGVTIWTDQSIDFVMTYYKGHPIHCPYWIAFLATVFGNGLTILFDIVVSILRLTK